MPIKILMPALSPTMKDGTLSKWKKAEGENVKPGEVIAEVETDKATMEVEAIDSGVLAKILVPEGTKNVAVNKLIAIILEKGEDSSLVNQIIDEEQAVNQSKHINNEDVSPKELVAETKSELSAKGIISVENNSQPNSNRIFASPLAKRIASENHINILDVRNGNGPNGRIIKDDVLQFIESRKLNHSVCRKVPESTLSPLSTMRSVIASRLSASKQEVPHFYLSIDANLTKLLELRSDINQHYEAQGQNIKISVNDLIIKSCAMALAKNPAANCSFSENNIIQYNNIDISVAVAIEGGLITPIIKNADQKTVKAISVEMRELANKAKNNQLRPDEFQGGSFSISNLGMYNIKSFSAIINQPQACILAVGASIKTPIIANNEIVIADVMNLTLSCDHRVVDGAIAANLLNEIKKLLEKPISLFV